MKNISNALDKANGEIGRLQNLKMGLKTKIDTGENLSY